MWKYVATVVVLAAVGMMGCASRTISNTPRTALEQLLLSQAIDVALCKFQMSEFQDAKVYLDFTNLAAVDAPYIKVASRARFSQLGAKFVEKPEEADYVAEVASGGLGTEYKNTIVGCPSVPVPSAPVPLPEVAFYKASEQAGVFKMLIFVHNKDGFVCANHYYAKCQRDESFLMWMRFHRNDEIRTAWQRADLKQGTMATTNPSL